MLKVSSQTPLSRQGWVDATAKFATEDITAIHVT